MLNFSQRIEAWVFWHTLQSTNCEALRHVGSPLFLAACSIGPD